MITDYLLLLLENKDVIYYIIPPCSMDLLDLSFAAKFAIAGHTFICPILGTEVGVRKVGTSISKRDFI